MSPLKQEAQGFWNNNPRIKKYLYTFVQKYCNSSHFQLFSCATVTFNNWYNTMQHYKKWKQLQLQQPLINSRRMMATTFILNCWTRHTILVQLDNRRNCFISVYMFCMISWFLCRWTHLYLQFYFCFICVLDIFLLPIWGHSSKMFVQSVQIRNFKMRLMVHDKQNNSLQNSF